MIKTMAIAVLGLMSLLGPAPARAAYLPAPEQRARLEQLLADYGKIFAAGRVLQFGDSSRHPGVVAYWYKFGDETVRWRLEEWVPLPQKGRFHLIVWDFQEDWAAVNEDIWDNGALQEIRYQEPLPLTAKQTVALSELTLKILLEADPADYNLDPVPDSGPHEEKIPSGAFGNVDPRGILPQTLRFE